MELPRAPGPERYRLQDLVVDADTAEVMRGDERIVLPPRTFELLIALARRFPHVVRRHDLLDTVWQGQNVTDQTLSHRVMVLRRALGDDAAEPRYVAGARGWGYRLLGPVERIGEGARRRSSDDPRPRLRGRRFVVPALVLGIAGVLGMVVVGRSPPSQRPRTVSVRPLEDRGLTSGLEGVAADLTGTLEAQLRRSGLPRVVPWDGKEPAPDLWIEGDLSGSVEQIEVRLRLVGGADRRALWAREVHGHLYEVLAGEEGIVAAAVEAAKKRLQGAATTTPTSPVSSRIQWQCLRAHVSWLAWTRSGNERAEQAWLAALDAEPLHAPAHAGVALAKGVAALLGYEAPAAAEAEARAHSRRALELDAKSGMVQAADAMVRLLFDRDVVAAAAAGQRADAADPEEPTVVMVEALIFDAQGRFDDSLGRLHNAAESDWGGILLLQGRAQQAKARWREAIATYDRALLLEPDLSSARVGRAECLTTAGRLDEALLALKGQGVFPPGDRRAPPSTASATELVRAWRGLCGAASPTPRERARACLLAGDPAAALDALHTGIEGRWPFVVFVPKDPAYSVLAGRPAFAAAFPRAQPEPR